MFVKFTNILHVSAVCHLICHCMNILSYAYPFDDWWILGLACHTSSWLVMTNPTMHSFFFFSLIFISWRLITLQYCSGFCHTLTWISHGFMAYLHVFPLAIPASHLPPHSIPLGLPRAPARALVSCIQPGLMSSFTLDSILVSVLFSQNIPPSPSDRKSVV